MMPAITPFLWFDSQAEDAMNFYVSIFPQSRVISVSRAGGRTLSVDFEIENQRIMALNGGPLYQFNESFSLFVTCETQAEIDNYWEKLTGDGGAPGRCGWLKDKYGLSWQVIPKAFGAMLGGTDGARTKRVVDAMMQMGKLELAKLQAAYDG
jgi:predicted 3-demethylubiquinone-9 3-methyltransferase (glyoxalase superfamily)